MYDLKIENMSLKDLYEESTRLQKMLIDHNTSEAVKQQILHFLSLVDTKISELNYMERFKKSQEGKSEVLEIGTAEEVVYTPDYSKEELLSALVFEYTTGDKSEKNTNGEKS